jgi:hypothetical protein
MKNKLMLILVGLIFAGFVAFIYYQVTRPSPLLAMTSRELVDRCTTDMATQFHIHSNLQIVANGQKVLVPANVGIDFAKNCMSSVHTHDDTGIIHVEAPVKKDFTLGDFFYKWNKPFSNTQIMDFQVDAEHGLKVFVNGVENTEFTDLIMQDEQNIVIVYYNLKDGIGQLPPAYQWPEEDESTDDQD